MYTRQYVLTETDCLIKLWRPVHSIDSEDPMADKSPPGVPRWVKALGLITLLVVAVAVAVMLSSGDEHGPDRHQPQSGARFESLAVAASLEPAQPGL